jgi:hypothetical protein
LNQVRLGSPAYKTLHHGLGINLSTLKRWMREPEFIQDYRRARWEVVEQGYARIQKNTPAAASILLKLMVKNKGISSNNIIAADDRKLPFAYNFIKIHRTLRVTPAMAAGVTDRLWDVEDLVAAWEASERRAERQAA